MYRCKGWIWKPEQLRYDNHRKKVVKRCETITVIIVTEPKH